MNAVRGHWGTFTLDVKVQHSKAGKQRFFFLLLLGSSQSAVIIRILLNVVLIK